MTPVYIYHRSGPTSTLCTIEAGRQEGRWDEVRKAQLLKTQEQANNEGHNELTLRQSSVGSLHLLTKKPPLEPPVSCHICVYTH
jgi:hypothetical protein